MQKNIFTLVLSIIALIAWGQPRLGTPKFFPYRVAIVDEPTTGNFRLEATGLPLPFFDNFNYSSTKFSSSWVDSTGPTITSQVIAGVTDNVLKFNGFTTRNGLYDDSLKRRVPTDSLLSLPINLNGYSESDSIKLSFTWHMPDRGLANADSADSFVLKVKDNSQTWHTLWLAPLSIQTNTRYTETFPLGSAYLYDGFQFQFLRTGPSYEDSIVWYLNNVEITKIQSLPFWEDFSRPVVSTTRFKANTGVYINNTISLNPPSAYVASFDGLDNAGQPYGSSFSYGPSDSLVSIPINLSGLTPADSIFLSFYWERRGTGEDPDESEGDSLMLKFMDRNGYWKSAWQAPMADSLSTSKFRQAVIAVNDPIYLSSNFRFKFINSAKQSGSFDLWHVDYIVLDTIKGRSNIREKQGNRIFYSDQAISKQPTSIVTPYYTVPSSHLTAFQFKDTSGFSISNLSRDIDAVVKLRIGIQERPLTDTVGFNLGFVTLSRDSVKQFSPSIAGLALSPFPTPFHLATTAYMNRTLGNSGNYLFEQNDTLSNIVYFDDYYAYDDGSYERTLMNLQDNASHALKFVPLVDDTLTAIDICIPFDGFNVSNSSMKLKVWPDNNGKPAQVSIMTLGVLARYSTGRNPFTRYDITPIAVKANVPFYIGFIQDLGRRSAIRIGFDHNNNAKENYFYFNDDDPNWTQFGNLDGAPMMRAVFGDVVIPRLNNNAKNPLAEPVPSLKVYPNPNQNGTLHLGAKYDRVDIHDLYLKSLKTAYSVDQIDLTGLQPGLYIITSYLRGERQDKKFIYQPY